MMDMTQLDQLRPWHRAVITAWLARVVVGSPQRHPNLAARIYRRYESIIAEALE